MNALMNTYSKAKVIKTVWDWGTEERRESSCFFVDHKKAWKLLLHVSCKFSIKIHVCIYLYMHRTALEIYLRKRVVEYRR